ncbi:MAG TPA: FHA domain-containing protein, partial [Blastocatellia bacterium]|nr:FHA domain-containing protein [Blastocatellia bacterium]
MSEKNKFIIRRSDRVEGVDQAIIESEGLTIGRAIGNDLPLNNRAVSRTHAGIKKVGQDFWVFNLSETNGTLLNGELVDKTPLADGDVLQIGPYTLRVSYEGDALVLDVDMDLTIQPEGTGPLPALAADASSAATTLLVRIPAKKTVTPGGTKRLQGTGLLTGLLPALDQQALDLFWEKRKREAGKIGEQTPLYPRGGKRFGKAQWNWRPTLDLSRVWRKSYFMWGALITTVLSVAAVLIYEKAYSPGPIADPHTRVMTNNDLLVRNIASQPNQESCSTCHGVVTGMYDK